MPRTPNRQPWAPRVGASGRIAYTPRRPAGAGHGPTHGLPHNPTERHLAPVVATVLSADEQLRVDAAGQGCYLTRHADTLEALAAAVQHTPVGAVVVSAALLERLGAARSAARLADVVRRHPAVPALALVSADVDVATVFALGQAGVRAVVDVRRPDGWALLRRALGAAARPEVAELAARLLAPALDGTSSDVQRFVTALFDAPPQLGTIRELARGLGVLPTTLMSRFFRARLPAPKRYLALARLARAADLLAHGSWTVASVADYLEYSSAQGFSRHLFLQLGVRPAEFRRQYTPRLMLDRFAGELLTPHHDTLRDFWPLRR